MYPAYHSRVFSQQYLLTQAMRSLILGCQLFSQSLIQVFTQVVAFAWNPH